MKLKDPNPGPRPSTPIRVGIYLRVSTRQPADLGQSLQAQKEEATQYAEQLLGPAMRTGSVTYYADLGRSGVDDHNPELTRLLADVLAGDLDLVLACSANRISRTWHGQARFEDAPAGHRVRFRSVGDHPQSAPAGSV